MTEDARRDDNARRDEAVRRAGAALETYTLAGDGWHRGPGETLTRVLADLMHWSDDTRRDSQRDTQRDFDAALSRAHALHAAERRG